MPTGQYLDTFSGAEIDRFNCRSLSVFYTFDSEGNVAQRSDATGTVLSNHLLDSHGALRSGSLSGPFGYKGQFGYYTDLETGLQLLTHRYYDPTTSRFLTRDPIGYTGGVNLYSYVTNNPLLLIDPEGTQTPPRPTRPSNDAYKRALQTIADATGSTLDQKWQMHPGSKSYEDAIRDLKHLGFKHFFNPNPEHWGGSDWEGEIEGKWYHVTVGYRRVRRAWAGLFYQVECFPSFVTAHWEGYQPSSIEHLTDTILDPWIP